MSTTTPDAHRLPRTITPRDYDIELTPDLEGAVFDGVVTIAVDVHEATSTVVLNAIELDIATASVDGVAAEISLDEAHERLTLSLPEPLAPGAATVHITFSGVLNDKLRGFYRSTFTDEAGDDQIIATTQFESTSARRAFPCWDEPDLKATFGVTLVIDDHLFAVSSGPEISRSPVGDGRAKVTFGKTMVMSTYLLAFIVGPLETTDPVDVDGVALRVIYPIGKAHLAPFALDAGAFSLRYFTEYFGIAYPDAKLDLVGIPDFAFGAMENQGCVTFRELLLLVDPETSSQAEQQRAVDVIAHEIAHMWFGNLVTMKWWNGIWLKEAFATFCETMCADAYRPDWERWVSFGLARSAAFAVDALESTRPIEFDVVSPDDAEAMYDVLTYEKGAAVVRMIEQYLGAEPFRQGVHDYLSTYSFSNTENPDLWDSIQRATGEPISDAMESWIFQGGYPLVSVERTGPGSIRLTQERFRLSPGTDDPVWHVPVVLTVAQGDTLQRHSVLLSERELDVDLGDGFDWIGANTDGSGFYRVRYQGDLLDAVVGAHDRLAPIERYGLVDDAWAAFLADRIDLTSLAAITDAIAADEGDLSVWQRLSGVARSIDHHLVGDARATHRTKVVAQATAALDRIGSEPVAGEDQRVSQLRATLLTLAGTMGDADTISLARSLLDQAVDPERAAAAVAVVAANGTDADFDHVVASIESAPTPQEERRFLFALADFPEPSHADRLLGLVDDGSIRTQDAPYVLGRALGNSATGGQIWDYVARSWDTLSERFPHNAMVRMVEGVSALAEPEQQAAVDAFFAEHPLPQAGKSLDQHLERLRVNVDVRRRIRNATAD